MGYDRGDSFSFDFEPNEFLFGSKSKGKLSPRAYPIHYERNWKCSFLSVVFAKVIVERTSKAPPQKLLGILWR